MRIVVRLLGLIAPFRRWIALAVSLGFLTIGSSVGLMAMSAYLISRSALVSDVVEVAIPITLVRVFATLRAAFRYLERYLTHRATFRILTHLRVWFYAAIEPLAPARLAAYRSGDLLARLIADIETLENFYVRVVTPPITAALVTALACLILGMFDGTLALALGSAPSAALVATRADLNATLVDEIQGIADLLSFDQSRQHMQRVLDLSRQLNRLQERMAMLRGVSNALVVLLTSLCALTVLGLAVPLVSGGKVEGVFLALLPLTAIASFEAVQPLAQALQQLAANQAAAGRLFDLIDATPPVGSAGVSPALASPRAGEPPALHAPEGYGIEFEDVRFAYNAGDAPALDGVSFSVPPGSRTAIVGPSGSGKSTVVNLLLRFWDCQQGKITIGGRDVCAASPEDVRKLLSVVPQQVHLFNATVRDNLLLANPDATDEQIVAACTMAQMHDVIQEWPQGYETLIGEDGLLLSGGERQRLAIARAILKGAPIVVFDEATANLDAVTEQRLLAALDPFLRQRTTLIIAHRLKPWPAVDQVVQLDSGRALPADPISPSLRPCA
jgi:ATP-binding cassette subfamily C protein CydC